MYYFYIKIPTESITHTHIKNITRLYTSSIYKHKYRISCVVDIIRSPLSNTLCAARIRRQVNSQYLCSSDIIYTTNVVHLL